MVERGPPRCLSLWDADVGEAVSLKAFVKLHFFEGVFIIAGADPGIKYPPVGGSWPFRRCVLLEGVCVVGISTEKVLSASSSSMPNSR